LQTDNSPYFLCERIVLLAVGKYDFLTGPNELWDDVKKYFKNITVKIFEKSSHCPMYEEAELFDNELIKWISQIENGE